MKIAETIKRILNFIRRHYYLLSSFLMFLSFPSYDVWFLKGFVFFAWCSLVPIFVFIRNRDYKDIIYFSSIAFLFGNLFTYHWIGNFGAEVHGGYAIILLFLVPSLTVFLVTKVVVAEFLSRAFPKLRSIIYASVWIFIDWIQSLGFLAFPWTYWGYSQYPFIPFIQIAKVTGVMGVTFVVILFNSLVADVVYEISEIKLLNMRLYAQKMMKLKSIRTLLAIIVLIMMITIWGVIIVQSAKSTNRDFRVAIIQTCINPWDHWSRNRMRYLAELERETLNAAAHMPHLIIWSESATLETFSHDFSHGTLNEFELAVLQLAQKLQIPILTGEIGKLYDYIRGNLHFYNNAVLINKNGEVVKWYSKINLVPFGEWFPYERWFPWVKNIVDSFGASNFTPGSDLVLFEVMNRHFGVLICYEGIFFRHVRRYALLGVDFMVNITNDGWTDTYNGHMQHFAASVFRAIENGKWFVRAGNTGYSTVIDPYGRTVADMPLLAKGYAIGDIDFSLNHETIYLKVGDIFLYIVFCFFGICLSAAVFQKVKGFSFKRHLISNGI